ETPISQSYVLAQHRRAVWCCSGSLQSQCFPPGASEAVSLWTLSTLFISAMQFEQRRPQTLAVSSPSSPVGRRGQDHPMMLWAFAPPRWEAAAWYRVRNRLQGAII